MNKKLLSFSALVALNSLIFSNSASALYTVGSLTNYYSSTVSYNIPVSQNKAITANPVFGNFSINVPGKGNVEFNDIGSSKPSGCVGAPTWGAMITYRGESWGFYYEGGGKIDVTINSDGSVGLSAINGIVYSSGECAHL